MRFNFDLADGWSASGEADRLFGISFSNGDAARFVARGLAFGYEIAVDGVSYEVLRFPDGGATWHEVSSNSVFSVGIDCATGAQIVISLWATWNGEQHDYTESYECPPPPSPHPSWSWNGQEWVAPIPCPAYGEIYAWSEQRQEWVAYPADASVAYSWDAETEAWVSD